MQKLIVLFVLVSLAAMPGVVPGQSGFVCLDRVAFSDDGREFYYPTNNTWFSSVNEKIRYFRFESGRCVDGAGVVFEGALWALRLYVHGQRGVLCWQ